MLSKITKAFRNAFFIPHVTERERMEKFLSQAVNNVHLEMLQRQWDRGEV